MLLRMPVEYGSIQIRPVSEEDRHAVMELASQLAGGVAEWRDPEGEVVGVVSVNTHQHFTGPVEAYIGELAVAPHAVRVGLGRRLLSAAEDWAHRQGLRHLTLETAAGNTTAQRFYAAVGYREEAIRFTRVLDQPGPAVDAEGAPAARA